VLRVRADLRIVVALRDGEKRPARVIDVSTGGMHLQADRVPEYGDPITVVVQLGESEDWYVIPATVRWFSRVGFGVAFEGLDGRQAAALAAFVDEVAA
jgi:Tfp pilus assembly protein PilZ